MVPGAYCTDPLICKPFTGGGSRRRSIQPLIPAPRVGRPGDS